MIKMCIYLSAAALLGLGNYAGAANLDCRALQLSSAKIPDGYAGQCTTRSFSPAVGNDFRAPTDIGFTVDILGVAPRLRDQLYTFSIDAFAGQILRNAITPSLTGVDFSPDASQLYAVSSETSVSFPKWLGVIPQPSGDFIPIGALTGLPEGDSIAGFAIHPRNGIAYLATAGGSPVLARLFTVNLVNGVTTLVGPMPAPTDPAGTIMISLAMNCEGTLIAHNISDDSLYSVNPISGATSLIGSHGLATNFAQGMDFDNTDGQLYAFLTLETGENRFGRFNTSTAAFTTLSNNSPQGEFEGAFPGLCPPEALLFSHGFEGEEPAVAP